MRKAVALVRARALTAASYRVQLALSIATVLVSVVPIYFVTSALQPVMSESIAGEGGHYFGFVLVGTIAFYFLTTAVNQLPGEFGSDLRTGTLEAVLSTPVRMTEIVTGTVGFGMLWTAFRCVILLGAGWILGVEVAWARLPAAGLVVGLLVLAYLPYGMLASASILAFRTAGPIAQGILFASAMLGGVYYPTRVIPSWLQDISAAIPLTYGLRALRRILLEGASLGGVLPDLGVLVAFVVVLSAGGALALAAALRYARRNGTLAQY